MVNDTMATLLEKLALFLDSTHGSHYVRGDHRMEIWLSVKEELPIIVSNMGNGRYIISSSDLSYELNDEGRAFRYILRIFFTWPEVQSAVNLSGGVYTPLIDKKQISYER